MNNKFYAFNTMLAVVLSAPVPVSAQTPPANNMDISQCLAIRDDAYRLACYDELARRTLPPGNDIRMDGPPGAIQGNRRIGEEIARLRMESSTDGNTRRTNPDEFGRNQPVVVERDDGRQELVGRIAALEMGPRGWIITLEQGQVWRQMITRRYDLREGMEVRIYPSRWGDSFRMQAENNSSFIQVERVR